MESLSARVLKHLQQATNFAESAVSINTQQASDCLTLPPISLADASIISTKKRNLPAWISLERKELPRRPSDKVLIFKLQLSEINQDVAESLRALVEDKNSPAILRGAKEKVFGVVFDLTSVESLRPTFDKDGRVAFTIPQIRFSLRCTFAAARSLFNAPAIFVGQSKQVHNIQRIFDRKNPYADPSSWPCCDSLEKAIEVLKSWTKKKKSK